MIGIITRLFRRRAVVAKVVASTPETIVPVAPVVDIVSAKRNLDPPDSDAIEWDRIDFDAYSDAADTAAFLDWHYVTFPQGMDVSWSSLWTRYQVFCSTAKVRPISAGKLKLELGPAGCTKRRKKDRNGKRAVVYGIVGRTHLVRRTA